MDVVNFLYKELIICDFKGMSIYHYTQSFVLKATQIFHSYPEMAAWSSYLYKIQRFATT